MVTNTSTNTGINTNKKYKNTVFTALFNNEEKARELYNALASTNYGPDTNVEITTLEDVLFMEQMNDISFVIDDRIVVLIEHQSTINKNMPLRMLLYIARVYEKICDNKNLYRKNMIKIPRPEFFVLYNGSKGNVPDKQTLKLSQMFKDYNKNMPIELEISVDVYNINRGHNPELAKRSITLDGYEIFIDLVREYEKETQKLDDAVKRAINECISRNVLKEYLERNGSEVRNMLLQEWNWEEALEVSKEEGKEEGYEEGKQESLERVVKNMKTMGIDVNTIAKSTGLSEDEILKL
ncbi:MAG: Rpn family recombination-promoting nuclease/putative transposase [Chitinispirillales bacterium]|jgi:hypothetical protein|nr:Rpn family recombination-promoting nuclease/putative transposase [Chitinispirillales bacterium]